MKISLIVLAFFISLSSYSQDDSLQKKKTLFGLRAGMNYSLLRSDQFEVEAGGRPIAGLFMQHRISGNLSIEAALSYSNKGSHRFGTPAF